MRDDTRYAAPRKVAGLHDGLLAAPAKKQLAIETIGFFVRVDPEPRKLDRESAKDAKDTAPQLPGAAALFTGLSFFKGGITLSRDNHCDVSFTAVYVSDEYWQDADLSTPTIPAKIPLYVVLNLAGDWKLTKNPQTHRRRFQPGGREILLASLLRRFHRARAAPGGLCWVVLRILN